MSQTGLRRSFSRNGTLTDMTSVTIGVTRHDTGAVVVSTGTAMMHTATGVYTYVWTDPAPGLVYDYVMVYVYLGATSSVPGSVTASAQPTATATLIAAEQAALAVLQTRINNIDARLVELVSVSFTSPGYTAEMLQRVSQLIPELRAARADCLREIQDLTGEFPQMKTVEFI